MISSIYPRVFKVAFSLISFTYYLRMYFSTYQVSIFESVSQSILNTSRIVIKFFLLVLKISVLPPSSQRSVTFDVLISKVPYKVTCRSTGQMDVQSPNHERTTHPRLGSSILLKVDCLSVPSFQNFNHHFVKTIPTDPISLPSQPSINTKKSL